MRRAQCALPQIATGDLDIAIVGQLSPPNLPLGDQFEPGPVKMVGFEAAFRRRCLWKQGLENAPGHADHTLIFADAYAEFDRNPVGVPPGVFGECENTTRDILSAQRSVLTMFSQLAKEDKTVRSPDESRRKRGEQI